MPERKYTWVHRFAGKLSDQAHSHAVINGFFPPECLSCSKCGPRLSAAAAEKLKNRYVVMRSGARDHERETDKRASIPITVRYVCFRCRVSSCQPRRSNVLASSTFWCLWFSGSWRRSCASPSPWRRWSCRPWLEKRRSTRLWGSSRFPRWTPLSPAAFQVCVGHVFEFSCFHQFFGCVEIGSVGA